MPAVKSGLDLNVLNFFKKKLTFVSIWNFYIVNSEKKFVRDFFFTVFKCEGLEGRFSPHTCEYRGVNN